MAMFGDRKTCLSEFSQPTGNVGAIPNRLDIYLEKGKKEKQD